MNITDIVRLNADDNFHCWQFSRDGVRCTYYSIDKHHLAAQMQNSQNLYEAATWLYEHGIKVGEVRSFMPLNSEHPLEGIVKFYKLIMLK